jgi:hypothetical protein
MPRALLLDRVFSVEYLAFIAASLAAILLVGPSAEGALERERLTAAARLVAADLSAAQELARVQQAPVVLTVNRPAQLYRIRGADGTVYIARRLDRVPGLNLAALLTASDTVRLLPYGYSDAALRMVLRGERAGATVNMGPTGLIEVTS